MHGCGNVGALLLLGWFHMDLSGSAHALFQTDLSLCRGVCQNKKFPVLRLGYVCFHYIFRSGPQTSKHHKNLSLLMDMTSQSNTNTNTVVPDIPFSVVKFRLVSFIVSFCAQFKTCSFVLRRASCKFWAKANRNKKN